MKNFDARRAFRLALLPAACAVALSACAPYEPVTTTHAHAPVTESPMALFDRLDTNRDGFLSRAELEPLGITTNVNVDRNATALFNRLDTNRDGFLSRGEAESTLAAIPGASFAAADTDHNGFLNMSEAMPQLRWLESHGRSGVVSFEAYDANGDALLSRSEADPLMRWVQANDARFAAAVPRSFEGLDANRDGFLSRAEAAPLANAATFDRYDANRDGFLSRYEADPLLGSNIGGTRSGYGGTVYGPR
jgi:Ca2+-binding EF-hand superfamily protein